MQRRIAVTLLAGFLAGSLPFLPASSSFFSIIAGLMPLFFLGFSYGSRAGINAGAIAIVTALLVSGGDTAFTLALLSVLPVNIMLQRLLFYRRGFNGMVEWYPTMRILAETTLLAAFLCLSYCLMVGASQTPISEIVRNSFSTDISNFDARSTEIITKILSDWGFILFSFAAWLWLFILWGLAVLSNRILLLRKTALRPDITFMPNGIPAWLMALLALFMGLALLGEGNDAFTGKAVVLILLVPYFVSGMAMIHLYAANWYMRGLWLFAIYIILFFFCWLGIVVAGAGVYFQIVEMLDKRKKIG